MPRDESMFDLKEYKVQHRIRILAAELDAAAALATWCFAEDDRSKREGLYFSTSAMEKEFLAFLELGECMKQIESYEEGIRVPLIMSDPLGITWVAEHAFCNGKPDFLIIVGPMFLSSTSVKYIEKGLASKVQSVQMRRQMTRTIEKIPVLSAVSLDQYAKMLHFILTNERIHSSQFIYSERFSRETQKASLQWSEEDRELWNPAVDRMLQGEDMLMEAVKTGNPRYRDILEEIPLLNSDFVGQTGDLVRDGKNSVLTQTILSCRAAIRGGVSVKTAKEIESRYIAKIESAENIAVLKNILDRMLEEFVTKVQEGKENSSVSRSIRECCDYIRVNVTRPLTVEEIAGQMGYTTYYFTKKFNKEMGIKVTDYIKQARIEYAKIALITTNQSIQEISDSLQFGSRNYFSKVFHSIVGMTPAAYREKAGHVDACGGKEAGGKEALESE